MKKTTKVSKKRTPKTTTEVAPVVATVAAPEPAPAPEVAKTAPIQTDAGKARSAGIQDYIRAGRPKPHQFEQVYGVTGPRLTWEQRAALGVPAEKFAAALMECMQAGKALYAPKPKPVAKVEASKPAATGTASAATTKA